MLEVLSTRLTTRLALAIFAALAAGTSIVTAQVDDPFADLMARGREAQATMSRLAASFVETSVSPLLVEPIVATGRVTATYRPLHVVMEYATPEPRTLTLDETTLVVSSRDRSEPEELDIATTMARVQKYFVDATPDDLRRSFDVTLDRDPDVAGGSDHLSMVPKRRQITEGLSRLDLWIDPVRLLLVRMRMEFPAGDMKTFEFSDLEVTAGPSPSSILPQSRPRDGDR